ncbi:hypothetical protein [Sulfurimonas sp.]|uniref:hypothetical protein n=1 Tax=Sulfurimonas sp. TaxID=2022749 RepID=UPI0026156381|nr:hypothetical protein [Sulfurimonas sp.]
MKLLTNLFVVSLLNIAAFGAPALNRKITFTQPDGTQFVGKQKGDASFHWIESGSDIVIYNPKDKYYYKAIVDKEKGIVATTQKMGQRGDKVRGVNAVVLQEADPDTTTEQTLRFLHKKAKQADTPR